MMCAMNEATEPNTEFSKVCGIGCSFKKILFLNIFTRMKEQILLDKVNNPQKLRITNPINKFISVKEVSN